MPGPIARPANMRHPLFHSLIRFSYAAGVSMTVVPFMWWFFHMRPKYQRYDEYFKNTDPYKLAEQICEKNLLDSCPQNLARKAQGLEPYRIFAPPEELET